MNRLSAAFVASILVFAPLPASAMQTLGYSDGWEAITFRSIPKTEFSLSGDQLGIAAPSSASVIYTAVSENARSSTTASWSWNVEASVPPTDLARKGGDDRNIALYFVFTDAATAQRAGATPNIKRLLASSKSTLLIYVHGGDQPERSFVPSPYFKGRGTTIIMRGAGNGGGEERADLAADHKRAFGSEPGVLIGVAVSSDSDDSGVTTRAELGPIELQ